MRTQRPDALLRHVLGDRHLLRAQPEVVRLVVRGKGNKEREVWLTDEAL